MPHFLNLSKGRFINLDKIVLVEELEVRTENKIPCYFSDFLWPTYSFPTSDGVGEARKKMSDFLLWTNILLGAFGYLLLGVALVSIGLRVESYSQTSEHAYDFVIGFWLLLWPILVLSVFVVLVMLIFIKMARYLSGRKS